jgi:hypothetical protein
VPRKTHLSLELHIAYDNATILERRDVSGDSVRGGIDTGGGASEGVGFRGGRGRGRWVVEEMKDGLNNIVH